MHDPALHPRPAPQQLGGARGATTRSRWTARRGAAAASLRVGQRGGPPTAERTGRRATADEGGQRGVWARPAAERTRKCCLCYPGMLPAVSIAERRPLGREAVLWRLLGPGQPHGDHTIELPCAPFIGFEPRPGGSSDPAPTGASTARGTGAGEGSQHGVGVRNVSGTCTKHATNRHLLGACGALLGAATRRVGGTCTMPLPSVAQRPAVRGTEPTPDEPDTRMGAGTESPAPRPLSRVTSAGRKVHPGAAEPFDPGYGGGNAGLQRRGAQPEPSLRAFPNPPWVLEGPLSAR